MNSIPESGRSPGGGHGNSFQYSCLEDRTTEEPGSPDPQSRQASNTPGVAEHAHTQGIS